MARSARGSIAMMTFMVVALVAAIIQSPVAAASYPMVGIRVIFAESSTDGATCTRDEHSTIVGMMHDNIVDLMAQQDERSLLSFDDDRRSSIPDPSWCRRACRGMAPGTCFVAYPPCDDTRRFLELEHEAVSDPDEFVRLCNEEQDAVLASIKDGVEEVSESCNRLLRTEFEVACSDLSDPEPVFISTTAPTFSSSLRVQAAIGWGMAMLAILLMARDGLVR